MKTTQKVNLLESEIQKKIQTKMKMKIENSVSQIKRSEESFLNRIEHIEG